MVTKRYIREKVSLLKDFQIYLTDEQLEYMKSLNEEYEVDQYAHRLIQEKDWDRIKEIKSPRPKDREKRPYKNRMNIRQAVLDFLDGGLSIKKIDYEKGGYDDVDSAYSGIHSCCARSGLPVRVSKRGNNVYFIRTDR